MKNIEAELLTVIFRLQMLSQVDHLAAPSRKSHAHLGCLCSLLNLLMRVTPGKLFFLFLHSPSMVTDSNDSIC